MKNSFFDSAVGLTIATGFLYLIGYLVLRNNFDVLDVSILYMGYSPYTLINIGFRSLLTLVLSYNIIFLIVIVMFLYSAFFEYENIVLKIAVYIISFFSLIAIAVFYNKGLFEDYYKMSVNCLNKLETCESKKLIKELKINNRNIEGITFYTSGKKTVVLTKEGIEVVKNDDITFYRTKLVVLKDNKKK